MTERDQHYLGDGLYARTDSAGMVVLSCERGEGPGENITHFVCLEPEVLHELVRWCNERKLL